MTKSSKHQSIPEILGPDNSDKAIEALKEYYKLNDKGRPTHSGSQFETIGHRWDVLEFANNITPSDLLALSTLSVPVTGKAAVEALSPSFQSEVHELLLRIPLYASFSGPHSYNKYLSNKQAPGWRLWSKLRELDQFGKARTSKLLARKRPLLFPINDKFVREAWDFNRTNYWESLNEAINVPGGTQSPWLWDHAISLGDEAKVPPYVSPLRVLDITVWHASGKCPVKGCPFYKGTGA